MAAPTFGTPNPQALDPYPIESVLAKEATGGSAAQAQNMLELYQMQRKAAGNVYGDELQSQHEFARQQLAQQLYETNLKAAPEYLKTAGGAQMLGGISGMSGLADPQSMQNAITASNAAQAALNLQHGGAGVASITGAGFQPTDEQAAAATGGLAGPRGDPTAISVAKLKLQGDLARAASHGAGGGGKTIQVPFKYGVDSQGHDLMGTVPVGVNATDAEIQARIDQASKIYSHLPNQRNLPGSTEPGSVAPPPSTPPATIPAPTRSATPATERAPGLARNPAAVTTPAPRPQAASKNFITEPNMQKDAKAAFRALPKQQQLDVTANMTSSLVPIVRLADGRIGFQGLNGTYALPAKGATP